MNLIKLTLNILSLLSLEELKNLRLDDSTDIIKIIDSSKKVNNLSGSIAFINTSVASSPYITKFTINDKIASVDFTIGKSDTSQINTSIRDRSSPPINLDKDGKTIYGDINIISFSKEKKIGISFATGGKPTNINI